MTEIPNETARVSLHGLRLENDLPMGATVGEPAEWDAILVHYRAAARDMRDSAGEYVEADPYHAEWHQLEGAVEDERDSAGACLWAVAANVIAVGALIGWALS
jgi:hypothetical protein